MIYHQIEHHDYPDERTVIQNVIDEGLPPDGFPIFLAAIVVGLRINTPMGEMEQPLPVKIPIKAKTISEAFSKFNETMESDSQEYIEQAVENFKKGMEERHKRESSKIITPTKMTNVRSKEEISRMLRGEE